MRLTNYTDYTLRVLLYLAAKPEDQLSNIKEISEAYNISKNHLMKVVYELGLLKLIHTIRGRGGGIKLAAAPKEINIGWVVRQTENRTNIVECFDKENNTCVISPVCKLKMVLNEALDAFLNVLDQYTLEDLLNNEGELKKILMNTSDS
ncbi:Rrf2 family transcriptional regulator [Chengkuizengella axinellae]|uniref:HTH-type transcriptional regulator NsrR n=1 Tax=Chengkuizengella axinellae TaxID=3064388 RepID=A0ABT9IUE3_9BACL|nr:Rrf2 family transcriptional regulator [Chengkuizengella sp. 2205SS18-9]MDP5272980.1 Rrf2 family transcriptional regulator [Chengkuizengella sp. 2205SS18-9]